MADDQQALLERLREAGVSETAIEDAARTNRYATLAVEVALGGHGAHSLTAVAREAHLSPAYVRELFQAIGRPIPPHGTHHFTDEDIELARIVRFLVDSKLPRREIIEVARVVGQGTAQIAEALRHFVGNALLEPGDSEPALGLRYAEAADELAPVIPTLLNLTLRAHLRESIRRELITEAERRDGELAETRDMAVAFADLAGYTKLGNYLEAPELGSIAGRFAALAAASIRRPVRIVKTIGDGVMFASSEVAPLVATLADLRKRAAEADPPLPPVRIGAAYGPATARGGDWFGATVNLASRLTGSAKPAQLLVTQAIVERDGDGVWKRKRKLRLKGVDGRVRVFSYDGEAAAAD
jgi:adenylate cyclase